VPDADREAWIEALPMPSQREYATRRVRDLRRFDAHPQLIDNLDDWSDWLQREVAERSSDAGALRALAERGNTRRTRGTARHRLNLLRKSQ
jgi:hypothetical protein